MDPSAVGYFVAKNIKKIVGALFLLAVAYGLVFRPWQNNSSKQMQAATAPAATAPAPTPPDPVNETFCVKTLQAYNHSLDAFRSYQREGAYVTVEVRDGFYLADFEDKQTFDALIRCAVSEGRKKNQGIELVDYEDARTHKTVATWGKYTGFSVSN